MGVTLHPSKGHCRESENIYILVILQEMTASVPLGSFPAGLRLLFSKPSIQQPLLSHRVKSARAPYESPASEERAQRAFMGCLRVFGIYWTRKLVILQLICSYQ